MLRLIPSAVPLWRSPSRLQLGLEGTVRLDDVSPAIERLIDALRAGVPEAMIAALAADAGSSPAEAEELLAALGPVLDRGPRTPTIMRVSFAPGVDAEARERVTGALRIAGARVTESADRAAAVVLVAPYLVEPRRTAGLVSDDIPHLPLELAGDRVTVGPFVIPGRTACGACAHAHRRDADPEWPLIAAQLLARPAPPTDAALIAAACALAVRMVSAPETEPALSATLRAGSVAATWREHEPHPACWCRSPSRTATPAARTAPLPGPTTAKAYARPA